MCPKSDEERCAPPRLRQQNKVAAPTAMNATPPTTPPAIAPAWDLPRLPVPAPLELPEAPDPGLPVEVALVNGRSGTVMVAFGTLLVDNQHRVWETCAKQKTHLNAKWANIAPRAGLPKILATDGEREA